MNAWSISEEKSLPTHKLDQEYKKYIFGKKENVQYLEQYLGLEGDIRTSNIETKKTGDIHNCWGSTVVEVIYPTNAITAKHKNYPETLLMPSVMSRIMFVG